MSEAAPVSNFDSADAVAYAGFVSAAYAMSLSNEALLTPTPVGIPAGWTFEAWITMIDFVAGSVERFYGIICSGNDGTLLVAFRGTDPNLLVEWIEDADCIAVPFTPVPSAGHVAAGFDKVYSSLRVYPYKSAPPGHALTAATSPAIATLAGSFGEKVQQVVKGRAGFSVTVPPPPHVVTGHSLGAALATLYVFENVSKGRINDVAITTFASPRVGNAGFVSAFNALPGLTSWRVVNAPDLVPNVPPDIFGWRHVDQQFLVNSAGKVQVGLPCAHSLATYVHVIDGTQALDPSCVP